MGLLTLPNLTILSRGLPFPFLPSTGLPPLLPHLAYYVLPEISSSKSQQTKPCQNPDMSALVLCYLLVQDNEQSQIPGISFDQLLQSSEFEIRIKVGWGVFVPFCRGLVFGLVAALANHLDLICETPSSCQSAA